MVYQEQISFETTGHRQMDDLTDQVAAIVGRSGVTTGIVQVSCVGSTAAVGTIEFEPGLEYDLPEMLDRLIPPSRDYGHEQAWHERGRKAPPSTAEMRNYPVWRPPRVNRPSRRWRRRSSASSRARDRWTG